MSLGGSGCTLPPPSVPLMVPLIVLLATLQPMPLLGWP